MKKTNRILSIILAILMAISIIPVTASAVSPTSGTCGDNLTWNYNSSTYTLTISGTGAMYDFTYDNRLWDGYSINKIIINSGVTTIGNNAFNNCFDVTSIILPDSITRIGHYAFNSTEYYNTKSNWQNDVLYIGNFLIKAKTDISGQYTVKIGTKAIADEAFHVCEKLTSITIPDSVVAVGERAFCGCSGLKSAIIGDGITSIAYDMFLFCNSLEYVALGKNIETIDGYAFYDCSSLKNITIPDSVIQINSNAFGKCINLESITIPDSVTSIDEYAFNNCASLTNVYFSGTEAQWNQILIDLHNDSLISAKIHFNSCNGKYKGAINSPTCIEQGYTTYTCECGDSYVGDYVDALGHSYTSEITTPATHTTTGIETFTCDCGDTYTETIEKIVEHNYNAVVTAPTCTEQGFTTYTCECGDIYVDDYVDALGHTSSTAVKEKYLAPTCTENGSNDVVVYCSVCGEETSRETVVINATGHEDTDNDGYCNDCDFQICNHRCHKSGFAGLIWKITNFFNKSFGLNKVCECGVIHY